MPSPSVPQGVGEALPPSPRPAGQPNTCAAWQVSPAATGGSYATAAVGHQWTTLLSYSRTTTTAQATAERREQMRADTCTDVVWERDSGGALVWVSPSVERILGWSPETLVGTHIADIVSPDALEAAEAGMQALLTGRPWEMGEVPLLTAAGTCRWMALRARPIVTADGQVTGSVAGLRDIHEQVTARDAAAESERRYHLLAGNTTDVVLQVDLAGVVQWVSPSVRDLLGYAPGSLIGTDAAELFASDDREPVKSVRAAISRGAEVNFEVRMRTAEGTLRWVTGRTVPARDSQGAVVGRITTVRDIDAQVAARNDLARSEETLTRAMACSAQGMALVDLQGRFLSVNQALCELLGRGEDDLLGAAEDDCTVASAESHADARARLVAGPDTVHLHDGSVIRADTRVRRVIHSLSLVRGLNGEPLHFVSQYQDVDDLVQARARAQESEELFRRLADNASDVVWQVDDADVVTWASPSVEHVLGWTPGSIIGTSVVEYIHPYDRAKTAAWRAALRRGATIAPLESRRLCADGTYRWMSVGGHPVPPEISDGGGLIITMRDIDDEVQTRLELSHALAHDPLTGCPTLPVTAPLIDRLLHGGTAAAPRSTVAVLCVGLDGVKHVNEALTHAGGDRLLTTVAARIAAVVSAPNLLARGSGDEFIVAVPQLVSGVDAGHMANTICAAVHGPVVIDSHVLEPTVSIGVATGDGTHSTEELVRDAALAMRQAKDNGRDRWEFFAPELGREAAHRLDVEDGIRAGLLRGEFVAWLQPIVDLDDTGVVGYEALVRWIRADTVTSPAEFLPVAESSHLIVDIDSAVLRHSLDLLASLPGSTYVSVNVSAATLTQPDYAEQVLALLAETDADPGRLHLEFTETAMLPTAVTASARRTMEVLADVGVAWYVDDFGTGYSSISHLRDLPIAGLKLDLSFTADLDAADRTSEHLAKALCGLAEGLELDTIAEGVETPQQAAILRALGWSHGQGWLYGRPSPAAGAAPAVQADGQRRGHHSR